MALTKARKVLESVLRRVWEHFLPNEPVGTRPLEEVLQRLQKNGYLPRKQAAYASAVKELGNVGTHVHDERIDKADVAQALSPLISVLEWYFEQEWAEGAAAPGRGRSPRRSPAASRPGLPPTGVGAAAGSRALAGGDRRLAPRPGSRRWSPSSSRSGAAAARRRPRLPPSRPRRSRVTPGPPRRSRSSRPSQGEWTVISHEVNGKIEDQDHLTKSDHRFRFEKTMWTHTLRRSDRLDLGLTDGRGPLRGRRRDGPHRPRRGRG